MLAVVNINGNQFKVSPNSVFYTPFMDVKPGAMVEFKDVIFFQDQSSVLLGKDAQSKTVKAEVVRQVKGEKVIAFKMKRRKGFRKKKGHRTSMTQLIVKEIF